MVTISQISQTPMIKCGSWLACDSGVTVNGVFAEPPPSQASQLPPMTVFAISPQGVAETSAGFQQFAVILAALLWSQYEFVADR
jgi:hypothetical protein